MPWINGRWRPEGWQTGGFHKGPVGGGNGFPGLLGDVNRGPIGDRRGVDNQPPQISPPGYHKGPQMQPTPYQPTQWAGPNAIYPNWGDPAGPYANDVAMIPMGAPYQPHTPWQSGLAPRQPWTPPVQQQMRPTLPPQVDYQPPGLRPITPPPPTIDPIRPPMPPQFPSLPPQMDPPRPPQYPVINPGGGWDPDPDWKPIDPKSDHAFNIQQREQTKTRLANERSITKAHLANLRGKGVSAKTIAKAKAKAQGRYTKIKGQSLRRGSANGKAGETE